MTTKSLAGTGKDYVSLQAYCRDEGLHIQGKGEEANRPYGLAMDIPKEKFQDNLWDWLIWLTEERGTMKSLVSDLTCYFPIQVRLRKDVYHFQVQSDMKFNRGYGAAFDVPRHVYPDLEKFAM